MIRKVKDTSADFLKGVYFEDINELVSNKPEAFLVQSFYFFYYSTAEAAKTKARSIHQSEDII